MVNDTDCPEPRSLVRKGQYVLAQKAARGTGDPGSFLRAQSPSPASFHVAQITRWSTRLMWLGRSFTNLRTPWPHTGWHKAVRADDPFTSFVYLKG